MKSERLCDSEYRKECVGIKEPEQSKDHPDYNRKRDPVVVVVVVAPTCSEVWEQPSARQMQSTHVPQNVLLFLESRSIWTLMAPSCISASASDAQLRQKLAEA